jgi:hypothetical protein
MPENSTFTLGLWGVLWMDEILSLVLYSVGISLVRIDWSFVF